MRRHDTDYFSLAAGLLFVLLGLMFAVSTLADWTIDGRWVVPVMLIALGAGGVAASLTAHAARTGRLRRARLEAASTGDASEVFGATPALLIHRRRRWPS